MKIRFGIIGTNTITDKVIAGAQEDNRFELSAVYSRTNERAIEFAQKYAIPHVFTCLEDMAASPLIDAVYIASPNALHAGQSLLFIKHGKHVLCEKAFCSNAREAKAVIDAARAAGVVIMEAMKSTLSPQFGIVMAQVSQIGPIRSYFSSYCQYSSRYDKFKAGIVMNAFRPELSNGALLDIGIYTIYPMVVLFGRPRAIHAKGILLPTGVDGAGSVVFDYGTMTATVLFSKIADSYLPTEIQGETGSILIDRIHTIGNVTLHRRNSDPEVLCCPDSRNTYYYEIKEFLDIILQQRLVSVINSHENSLIVAEIMDEIRRQLGVVYPADNDL